MWYKVRKKFTRFKNRSVCNQNRTQAMCIAIACCTTTPPSAACSLDGMEGYL